MELKKMEYDLTVCKVSAIADIDMDADFYFIGKTGLMDKLCRTGKMTLECVSTSSYSP